MTFENVNGEYNHPYYDNAVSNHFDIRHRLHNARIAFVYGALGAMIATGIFFLLGFIVFLIDGDIIYAIGSAALTYSLLYGSYGMIKKKRALDMFSPYIFN